MRSEDSAARNTVEVNRKRAKTIAGGANPIGLYGGAHRTL
jgi:hypothetical protein